jgi:hypothetical protein
MDGKGLVGLARRPGFDGRATDIEGGDGILVAEASNALGPYAPPLQKSLEVMERGTSPQPRAARDADSHGVELIELDVRREFIELDVAPGESKSGHRVFDDAPGRQLEASLKILDKQIPVAQNRLNELRAEKDRVYDPGILGLYFSGGSGLASGVVSQAPVAFASGLTAGLASLAGLALLASVGLFVRGRGNEAKLTADIAEAQSRLAGLKRERSDQFAQYSEAVARSFAQSKAAQSEELASFEHSISLPAGPDIPRNPDQLRALAKSVGSQWSSIQTLTAKGFGAPQALDEVPEREQRVHTLLAGLRKLNDSLTCAVIGMASQEKRSGRLSDHAAQAEGLLRSTAVHSANLARVAVDDGGVADAMMDAIGVLDSDLTRFKTLQAERIAALRG